MFFQAHGLTGPKNFLLYLNFNMKFPADVSEEFAEKGLADLTVGF